MWGKRPYSFISSLKNFPSFEIERENLSSRQPLIPYPFQVAVFVFVILWSTFLLSQLSLPVIGNFFRLGIIPRHPIGLIGIFTAPWNHADIYHLLSNQALLLHLVFLSILKPNREVIILFLLVFTTGLGVWIFGSEGNHLGASGLIFALQSFNVLTAIYTRRWWTLGFLILFLMIENTFLYGVWGGLFGWIFNNAPISYSSHIFGFISGILWAGLLRSRPSS